MPFDSAGFVESKQEVTLEPWQRVLLDAAKEVRKGWLQGECGWWEREEPVCAGGALMRVMKLTTWPLGDEPEAWRNLEAHVKALGFSGLPGWNDTHGQTAESVASTMERVALGERR